MNKENEGINVLSLFDGMSSGMIALERAGIKVKNYYASEIDKHAIKVSKTNYPNIIQLGDVTQIDLSNLPKIDLLIGGSPCQGFSMAGKQVAFDDPRSKLYFEYERILKELQVINPNIKFLLENVKMKQEHKDVITARLGVEPIAINSNLVSAQNRYRLYWTNLEVSEVEDRGITLEEVTGISGIKGAAKRNQVTKLGILPFINIQKGNKSNCVVSSFAHKLNGCIVDGVFRALTPIECERLQTIPDNYTSCVSDSQRYKMLGNGWTVDVIAHIFQGLK